MPDNIQPPAEGNNIEQLLSQLSPEELEQLATALSADMQNPAAHEGGESVSGLAQAIESHLGQSPEAEVPEAAPEKVAALNFVKSASYIEGFLNHALDNGVAVKQAVDLYDQALSSTISNLRKEAAESKAEEKKESKKHEKSETIKQEKKEHEDMEKAKIASYYDGVFSRAREYGLSDRETAALLKSAAGETINTGNYGARGTSSGSAASGEASGLSKLVDKLKSDYAAPTSGMFGSMGSSFPNYSAGAQSTGEAPPIPGAHDVISKIKDIYHKLNPATTADAAKQLGVDRGFGGATPFALGGGLSGSNFMDTPREENSVQSMRRLRDMFGGGDIKDPGLALAAGKGTDFMHAASPEQINMPPGYAGPGNDELNNLPELPPGYAGKGSDALVDMPHYGLKEKLQKMLGEAGHSISDYGHQAMDKIRSSDIGGKLSDLGSQGMEALQGVNPQHAALAALLAGGGAYGLHKLMGGKKKQDEEEQLQPKEAAYYEGMLKRASEYGLNRAEFNYLLTLAGRR